MKLKHLRYLTEGKIFALSSIVLAILLFVDWPQQGSWIPHPQRLQVETPGEKVQVSLVVAFLLMSFVAMRMRNSSKPPKLGHILVVLNKLSRAHLEAALNEFRRDQRLFGEFLVDRGYALQVDIERALKLQEEMALLMQEA